MQLICIGGGAGGLVDGTALLLQPLQQLQVFTLGSQVAQADWPTGGRDFHLPHCSPCRAARALEYLQLQSTEKLHHAYQRVMWHDVKKNHTIRRPWSQTDLTRERSVTQSEQLSARPPNEEDIV